MAVEVDDRIKQHYLLEKKLARRILASSQESRTQVFLEAYNELFSRIPWHPLLRDSEGKELRRLAEKQMFFEPLIDPNADILDIGAGAGYWIRFLAKRGNGRCVGIDISKEILMKEPDDPLNLELHIMDAVKLDFPTGSFDIIFSSQLIEHLHPDDVERHFINVYKVLRVNGVYAFDTPSRLNGPHDVSKHFDDVATGFHLKEWTYTELAGYLKKAGFRKIRTMVLPWTLVKHSTIFRILGTVPASLIIPGERLAGIIKHKRLRTALCKLLRIAPIYVIAHK